MLITWNLIGPQNADSLPSETISRAIAIHWLPKWFPIAADLCLALLFSARNMGGVCNTPLHGRSTMAAVIRSPPKCFPIAADTCRALLFPARNMGGVCFCAPTRTSDNGRCRSFAPEMFSDCGGYLSGAIVLGPEHGGRMQYAPTRTSDNGCCHSFAPVGIHFIGHRVPSAGRVGAYCIRPIKWPRRGQIRRQQISVGRYCFLPGTSGAYAFAPLHGRPTMAAVVHSPPKCFPIAADTRQALLFSARNIGGVCNTPLHGRPTMADDVRSPPKCFPIAADACRALLFPTRNMGGVCFCAPTRTSDGGA